MFRRIAVALDETEQAQRALRTATDLAKTLGAALVTVTVRQPLPAYTAFAAAADSSAVRSLEDEHTKFYEQLMATASARVKEADIPMESFLVDGDTVDVIVEFVAQKQIDLLVVGLHRRSLRVYSLWSTVYSLAQDLSCNMLGVH